MSRRGQAWRTPLLYSYWPRITVGLRMTSARHGEAAAWGRGATPLSTEFRAQNNAALKHVHRLSGRSRPLWSAFVEYQAPPARFDSNLREDRLVSEHLRHCYTQIATSPQDTTDHVSRPAKPNVTWDTNFPW